MTEPTTPLAVAREAVEHAREVLTATSVSKVQSKHERDLVSNVDVTIERAVRTFLADATPGYGFIGEEEGTDDAARDFTWILDPIDGTSNFLHGIPLFGISLALVHERQAIVGVIALPAFDSVYYAASGAGAFKNGDPIHARETTSLAESIVSIGDYAVGGDAATRNRSRFSLTADLAGSVERVRMVGSAAVDMAWVAEGRTDAAIALSNSAWDFTAGVAIAREAGVCVRDIDGAPHSIDARGIIAAVPGITDPLVQLTQRATAT